MEAGSSSIPPREGGTWFLELVYTRMKTPGNNKEKTQKVNNDLDAAKRQDTTRTCMPLNRPAHRDPALR